MGEIFKDAFSVATTCIGSQFCYDGGTVDNSQLSLPRTLRVKIIANPEFWGFAGTNDDNVLVSGYATFSNGRYDFFDGFQPEHLGHKVCGRTDVGYYKNEQRPDVGYRSVYDDEEGVTHYNGNSNDVMRGGAEVYLIDRTPTKTTDQNSCDETDPQSVFKKTPDNYGFGNKVLFNDDIYKNITGAWRLSSCDNCYSSGVTNTARNVTCSGDAKQEIHFTDKFGQHYDKARQRCLSPRYSGEIECQPDGTTPFEYKGKLLSLIREDGNNFIKARVQYFDASASGLRNGQQLLITDSGNVYKNAYHIFDVVHISGFTEFKLTNTFSSGVINYTGLQNDKWIALGTIDPESCCGGAALGVDNKTKSPARQPVYHIDIPKIFNNAKNKMFSNRDKSTNGTTRTDRSVVAASGSGELAVPRIENGLIVNPKQVPYYGPYYLVDNQDTALRYTNNGNSITHKNYTCYTKSQTVSIFPDCLTQSYRYKYCDQNEKYYQINVPRLAFVYRPCEYNEPCDFNDSGVPYTAGASGMPSTLEDLKRGFGGQEFVMYLNLGDAWAKEIKRQPCSCDGEPQGTNPPEVVVVKSPVTYTCFPKFDLYPENYGCQDPSWYVYAKNYLGIEETGTCGIAAYYNACWHKQPYTTYGFVRSLCGHESHTRKEVIQSLATKLHGGSFNDSTVPTGVISTEPYYKTFIVPSDQTGSGFPVGDCSNSVSDSVYNSGGFSFGEGACISGTKPYWGLIDTNGRLAYPYFYTKISSGTVPCSSPTQYQKYVNFDDQAWFSGGFPTENVPFLIEIDHEDYCVGCPTTQLELKDHFVTIESLPTKFYHGGAQVTGRETYDNLTYKYGFNHCKYPGIAITPTYDINNDSWRISVCDGSSYATTEAALQAMAVPYTGETCGCIGDGGITTSLRVHPLVGTNIPKYWASSGVENSYVKFSGCEYGFSSDYLSCGGGINGANVATVLKDYDIYFAARMNCGSQSYWNGSAGFTDDSSYANGLGTWLQCGGCSHSYPATNSKPNIDLDFYYVRKRYRDLFERMSDIQLKKCSSFLNNGASNGGFTTGYRNTSCVYGECLVPNCETNGASGILFPDGHGGQVCYNTTGWENFISSPYASRLDEKAMTYNGYYSFGEYPCSFFLENPDPAIKNKNYIKWTTNIPGCHGAKIKVYGIRMSKDSGKDSEWVHADSHYYGHGAGNGFPIPSGCDVCSEGVPTAIECGGCEQGRSDYGPGFLFMNRMSNGLGSGLAQGPTGLSCDDYIPEIACLGPCGGMTAAIGCVYDENDCCRDKQKARDTGLDTERPNQKFKTQCWLDNLSYEFLGEFTYFEFTSADVATYGPGTVDGWYGWLIRDHWLAYVQQEYTTVCGFSETCLFAWSGEGLPNIGDTEILPFDEPIAFRYTDVQSCFNTSASMAYKSICAYDQSVNRVIQVDSEFIVPKRSRDWGKEVHLNPIDCTVLAGPSGAKVEVGSTCVKPIPFNTFNNTSQVTGYGSIETVNSKKINVIKPACFPEIMTVHKVECAGGVYALHVSREYYEHDRILYTIDPYVDTSTNLIVANRERLYGRLDGGGTITKYTCHTKLDELDTVLGAKNTYEIASYCGSGGPLCSGTDTMDYFGLLPKMAETDSVTPCYPVSCVTGVNPFQKRLCANYEVGGGTIGGGNGTGGSGYFQVLPSVSGSMSGCIQFFITNPGSGYYSSLYNSGNDVVTVTGCAIADFDIPACVSIKLRVYPNLSYDKKFNVATQSLVGNSDPSISAQYFVYSGEVSFSDCGGYANCGFPTGIYNVTFDSCNNETITLPCEPSNQVCDNGTPYYPNLYNGGSGTRLWNFYNIFYDSGYLGGLCLEDADEDDNVWFKDDRPDDKQPPFPFNIQYDAVPKHGRMLYHSKNTVQQPLAEIIPFSETGVKCLHSCIQDHTTCGGDFFCNKEFFPRRAYAAGTKVSKLAPFSMCVQNGKKGYGGWLQGHVDDEFMNTYDESTLGENSQNGWLDPCKNGATTPLLYNLGIDDHIIYVNDITPLLGAKHPYYKLLNPSGLDTKQCVMPRSGCFDFLGTHNARTIAGVETKTFETGDSDTYSEIKQSGCLFEPFKIFMDIQCCQERLGHPGSEDPMFMSWITQGVPAGACKGIVFDASCSCQADGTPATSCGNNARYYGELPYTVQSLTYWYITGDSVAGCEEPGACPESSRVYFQDPGIVPYPSSCCFVQSGQVLGASYEGNYYVLYDSAATLGMMPVVQTESYYLPCNNTTYSTTTNYLTNCQTILLNNATRNIVATQTRFAGYSDFCNLTAEAILIGSSLSGYISPPVAPGSGVDNFGAYSCDNECNSNCASRLAKFGCKCSTKARECIYGSIVKLTVTE